MQIAGEEADLATAIIVMRMQVCLVRQLHPTEYQQGDNQDVMKSGAHGNCWFEIEVAGYSVNSDYLNKMTTKLRGSSKNCLLAENSGTVWLWAHL